MKSEAKILEICHLVHKEEKNFCKHFSHGTLTLSYFDCNFLIETLSKSYSIIFVKFDLNMHIPLGLFDIRNTFIP